MRTIKLEAFYHESELFTATVIQIPHTNKYYARIYIHKGNKIVETTGTHTQLLKNLEYILNNTDIFSTFDFYGVH